MKGRAQKRDFFPAVNTGVLVDLTTLENLKIMLFTTAQGKLFWVKYLFKNSNSELNLDKLEHILYALDTRHYIKLILYLLGTALLYLVESPVKVSLRKRPVSNPRFAFTTLTSRKEISPLRSTSCVNLIRECWLLR